jgi:hypothetical protein
MCTPTGKAAGPMHGPRYGDFVYGLAVGGVLVDTASNAGTTFLVLKLQGGVAGAGLYDFVSAAPDA